MANIIADKLYMSYHGPFSQWHPAQFMYHDVNYCCAEKAMMAAKAKLFDDNEMLA